MEASSLSPEFYEMQAALAANELDFELHLSACEAEAKSVINGSLSQCHKQKLNHSNQPTQL
ncbi:hypothetical protein [Nostoc piscinale]|uniref:hypothetical protein n=1 Tax=Nostoc piscinale TaxID=224012 RepID=UPI0011876F59|nr:hypothetical protein [Nostoc piscinale]